VAVLAVTEGHNTASDISELLPASEPEVDFSRLDLDAEQLVASLFGDDDSSVSFEHQPPTDNKKGFVPADHEDAAKWFYQDPQGVIQGEFTHGVSLLIRLFNALSYFYDRNFCIIYQVVVCSSQHILS